jgi:hypothetical protein
MQTWKWLYHPATPFRWRFIASALVRTAILFVALNALFAASNPLPTLGRVSAYNLLFQGRERLPYGENPAVAYNLSLFNIDAMFASHKLAGVDHDGEYRVLLIGDSSIWGILQRPGDTLVGQINTGDLRAPGGSRVRVYNLGYPTMSLTKDLMFLDYAMRYDPDLIVWSFTLESFDQKTQLDSPIVQHNPDRVKPLIEKYDLNQDADDSRFVEPSSWWEKTIVKQRRALADLLRLQFYGVPWAVTGIDQEYRADYTPRAIDLEDDNTWHEYAPQTFTEVELAFEVLRAGVTVAGDTPVLFINEPMFISDGENSDIRYNAFFPRWAYDEYRRLLAEQAAQQDWQLLDLWDMISKADCYTDSAVHLTPVCSAQLGQIVGQAITQMADTGTLAAFDAGS